MDNPLVPLVYWAEVIVEAIKTTRESEERRCCLGNGKGITWAEAAIKWLATYTKEYGTPEAYGHSLQ